MRLYVMRHGPADDHSPTGRDFDRALTEAGREVVSRAARELQNARGVNPAAPGADGGPIRVLSSPLRRARETAELVAGVISSHAPSVVEVELHDDLAADAELPLGLVGAIREAGTDALLVGHQPTVEELVRVLLHPSRPSFPGGFRTATIVALEAAPGDRFQLATVLDPYRLP
jgi:phosphohistidine phosphatase